MSFPTYDFTPKVDNTDTIYAADINELQDAIEEIAERDYGGGGGGVTFPMAEGVWYDSTTAITCMISGSLDTPIGPGNLYASPFMVSESVTVSMVGLSAFNGMAVEGSLTITVYTASAECGPGDKVGSPIAVPVEANGDGFFSASADIDLDAGLYFLVTAGNPTESVSPYNVLRVDESPTNGFLGLVDGSTDQYTYATGYFAEVVGVPDTMPASLTSDVAVTDRVAKVPQILFQITHP